MSVKLPAVLSVQRGTIVSDGVMSSVVPQSDGSTKKESIRVIRHGIRGTNINPKGDDPSNIQRTESAKTCSSATGLEVRFAFRTIDATSLLFACASKDYRKALEEFVERFFQDGVPEFDELCRRYARNVLNGRWLWRNRTLGHVSVQANAQGNTYSSKGSSLMNFNNYTNDEISFARDVIAAGFLGQHVAAEIVGTVDFGFTGQVEVYPSQNMVTSKPDGFARSLYKTDLIAQKDLLAILSTSKKNGADAGDFSADMIDMGRAALRDQKIGNALRTIDTWYPDFNGSPIPIEPNGASLEFNTIYRTKKSGSKELLTLIDELKPGTTVDPRAIYVMALLVRGGVFSEKQ